MGDAEDFMRSNPIVNEIEALRDENALLRPLYDELKGCKWSADDGGENKLAVMLANLERYYADQTTDATPAPDSQGEN